MPVVKTGNAAVRCSLFSGAKIFSASRSCAAPKLIGDIVPASTPPAAFGVIWCPRRHTHALTYFPRRTPPAKSFVSVLNKSLIQVKARGDDADIRFSGDIGTIFSHT